MFKEIVTKAILGKGKKSFTNKYTLIPEITPSTILGCWIINHEFKGYAKNETIVIEGSYDINIWYSYESDTKTAVATKKETYYEEVNINKKEGQTLNDKTNIIVRSLKQPNCTNVDIVDNNIEYQIEKELGIEVIGETKVKIAVEQDEEPWEIINDIKEEDINDIKEDYIKSE